MTERASGGFRKFFGHAREHLTHAAVGGLVLMATGFTPEHLFAEALDALHVPADALKSWMVGLDPRVLLVLLGMTIIVGDQLLRRRASRLQLAAPGGGIAPAPQTALADPPHPAISPTLALPDNPSIAVLPFQNMSEDAAEDYFADGVVEDIITGLSRIKRLFVIARNSTFAYKGTAIDIKQVGRELGVRYVVEGSVRKAAGRVRVTAQLIEAESGAHVWAERYDRKLDDIFVLQDEVTLSIVAAIEPSLRIAELERVKRKRSDSLDAYDLVLQAQPDANAAMPEAAVKALALLDRALALEPDYALAHAYAALCHHNLFLRAGLREEERAASVRHAQAAIACGQDDALALTLAGFCIAMDGHDRPAAFAAFDAALAVSPSSALTYIAASVIYGWAGNSERAIDWAQRGMRLSPFDPWLYGAYHALTLGNFNLGNDEAAADAARKAVQAKPGFSISCMLLAAPLARLGRLDEAKAAAARLLELQPNFRYSRQFAGVDCEPALAASMGEALRIIGLPE